MQSCGFLLLLSYGVPVLLREFQSQMYLSWLSNIFFNLGAASDVGGGKHHPEALQRLVEMELRSKSKPIHPFAMGGHGQRMYGHELDNRHGFWT